MSYPQITQITQIVEEYLFENLRHLRNLWMAFS